MTHDSIVEQALEAVATVRRDDVLAAFVGSLSTRNLPARSAFGSYVVLQHFARHELQDSTGFGTGWCAYCNLPPAPKQPMTEERIASYPSAVQHTDIKYAAYDLQSFSTRAWDRPTAKDVECLKNMLDAIRALPPTAQLSELNRSLQGTIKSNKLERWILLETWGYAGILCPPDQDHYSDAYVPSDVANSRQPAQYYKREWQYPVRFWTGEDGVNEKYVERYFGQFL